MLKRTQISRANWTLEPLINKTDLRGILLDTSRVSFRTAQMKDADIHWLPGLSLLTNRRTANFHDGAIQRPPGEMI